MNPADLLRITGARLLRDGQVVFAGVGAPLEASVLAKRLHAPALTIVLEGGSIGARMLPGRLPVSTNEMRGNHGAVRLAPINDIFFGAQRGAYDVGFIGAGQIDRFGNVNTSVIGDPDRPKLRFGGGGGANDIVSSCPEIIVMTRHERRRFVERVDFVTSPGFLDGGDARARAGLTRGRPRAVLTDLALFGYDESGRMRLDRLQPGVTVEHVREHTGFELLVADDVSEMAPPTERELAELHRVDHGDAGPAGDARIPDRPSEVTTAP